MFEQDIPVVFHKKVAADTFLMGMESPQIVAESRPGQFVMIRIQQTMDPLLRRPFSICGTQGDNVFLILYRIVGRGTARISNIGQGEKLSVLAPLGKGFEIRKDTDFHLIIGGGIGIAPLIYLAQALEATPGQMMIGYRHSNEIVPMEPFGLNDADMLIATDDGSSGYDGFVTELLEEQLSRSEAKSPVAYACGPTEMLKEVTKITQHRDISCQISMEAYMACGIGACQGCAVPSSPKAESSYYHVCQDGPVFWAHSLEL